MDWGGYNILLGLEQSLVIGGSCVFYFYSVFSIQLEHDPISSNILVYRVFRFHQKCCSA